MQKPGLGARKCGTCGARIEGPQSHLLRECPYCRTSLYGRFVPAPAAAPSKSAGGGSGAIIAVLAMLGLGALGAIGAVVYVLSTKKAAATTVSAPPSGTGATPTPLLAETAAPSASASASASARHGKPDHAPSATTITKPIPSVTATSVFGLKPPPSASTTASNGGQRCTATMLVSNFRPSTSTCSFNEKVRQGPGRLDFPCDGGPATATFGSQVFSGSVTSSFVSLTESEPFDFHGCSVISTQRIVGARSSSQASYSYSERIVGGACDGVTTCRATATIDIR